MGTFIIRRLLWMVVLLFVITLITFIIFNVFPSGDPARLRAGRNATPDALAAVRDQLHLNWSKPHQFIHYLTRLIFHGDFGTSINGDANVREQIFRKLPNTLFLIAGAAVVWFLAGISVGTLSAVKRGSWIERISMTSALVLISAPVYWLGLVALYLFSDDIGVVHIFPGAGAFNDAHGFLNKCWAMSLPWIVLACAFAAIYARLLRSNLLEVMGEDYIRTARAKGLPERSVIRHGLRSAITPIVTVLGLDLGILVGGAILTESVFEIDGIGKYSYDAINRVDLVTIQGTTLFFTLAVCVMSIVVDVLYGFLDPRVRY